MLSVVRNDSLFINGYLEWAIVNADGKEDDRGEYIAIKGAWIHPDCRRRELLYLLSKQIYLDPLTYHCKYVYWQIVRNDTGKKANNEGFETEISRHVCRTYTKDEIMNLLKGDPNVKRSIF